MGKKHDDDVYVCVCGKDSADDGLTSLLLLLPTAAECTSDRRRQGGQKSRAGGRAGGRTGVSAARAFPDRACVVGRERAKRVSAGGSARRGRRSAAKLRRRCARIRPVSIGPRSAIPRHAPSRHRRRWCGGAAAAAVLRRCGRGRRRPCAPSRGLCAAICCTQRVADRWRPVAPSRRRRRRVVAAAAAACNRQMARTCCFRRGRGPRFPPSWPSDRAPGTTLDFFFGRGPPLRPGHQRGGGTRFGKAVFSWSARYYRFFEFRCAESVSRKRTEFDILAVEVLILKTSCHHE